MARNDELRGSWNTLKGKLRQQWGKLTDDDVEQIGGRKDELIGRLQRAYGRTKEEVAREVNEFLDRHQSRV